MASAGCWSLGTDW